MNDLEKVKVIAAEENVPPTTMYDGIAAGNIPVVKVGKKSYRISREMWARHKRGEPIADRYFLKKGAA